MREPYIVKRARVIGFTLFIFKDIPFGANGQSTIMVHIGSIIEHVFHEQGRSPSWFAEQLHCDRTNVYNIFKRESVDTSLLVRISNILQHDFLQYYKKELSL